MSTPQATQPIDAATRKTPVGFVITEFFIYLSQFLVFFFSAAIVSGLFRDEKRLLEYVNAKITADSQFELWVTVVSLAAVLGILFAITSALSGKLQSFAQSVALEALQEFPKLIYAVGSSVGGIAAAVGVIFALHPATEATRPGWWIFMSAFIGFGFFVVGVAISFAIKRKTHITLN